MQSCQTIRRRRTRGEVMKSSTSPMRQPSHQRCRLSIDESMDVLQAAEGLFVLAQVTGGHAAAQSAPTRKARPLPRESGKVNDGLQPQIWTRDAIAQHQCQPQILKPNDKRDMLRSSLALPAGGSSKLTAPAALHQQQPHHPDLYNKLLSHPAKDAPIIKSDELIQLHANQQQLQSLFQKRRIFPEGAGPYMYAAIQSQLWLQPPAKRVKTTPLESSAPTASSATPGRSTAPKKRILARKVEGHVVPSLSTAVAPVPTVRIDRKQLSLAPEEEIDPQTGNLNYCPKEDETTKNGAGVEGGITVSRGRAFMSSHLGKAAVPQSGYGALPSWRVAKRKCKRSDVEASLSLAVPPPVTAQGRVARDALTKILPSLSPTSDGDMANTNKMRSKISALM
jgi:hypothetical protein